MKVVLMNTAQIDLLDPKTTALSLWVGGDDILVQTVEDVFNDMVKVDETNKTPHQTPTVSQALDWSLKDVGGNSFSITTLLNGELVDVQCI